MCPVPLASYADGIVAALRAVAPGFRPRTALDGARLLGERAALAGYRRAGDMSPGGSCRLLATGWLAGGEPLRAPATGSCCRRGSRAATLADWGGVAAALRQRATRRRSASSAGGSSGWRWRQLRARPEADRVVVPEPPGAHRCIAAHRAPRPLVVDLSALWAGPLCTHLLQLMGAQVIKVESTTRPDGMRARRRRVLRPAQCRQGERRRWILRTAVRAIAAQAAAAAQTSSWKPRGRARCASWASTRRRILR